MEQIANYPVLRKLGEGATSEVFLCQDPFRGREVAVKRIHPETLRDPARGRLFRKLFFTEASLAGKLEHPHIAQIYDAGIGEDSGYIVMEYVPGGTMERFCAPENLLPVEQTVEIAFKCARALAYAHAQGVTHRDIKPGNILYAGSPTDVRIGDFGLAQRFSAETTQITGIGSPAYMSPEQVREELVDHRTDLYSLGVVLYQLLTGQLPFRGVNKYSIIYQITQQDPPPPSTLRREVPTTLDRIVRRAMQKEAGTRYQSGDEFAEELIEALHAGLGDHRETFGDADKFAALRAMRFFKAFTDPAFRGRGLLRECLKAVEHSAVRDGRKEMTALVEIHNRSSLRAFRSAGFARCGLVFVLRRPWVVSRLACHCATHCSWSRDLRITPAST